MVVRCMLVPPTSRLGLRMQEKPWSGFEAVSEEVLLSATTVLVLSLTYSLTNTEQRTTPWALPSMFCGARTAIGSAIGAWCCFNHWLCHWFGTTPGGLGYSVL